MDNTAIRVPWTNQEVTPDAPCSSSLLYIELLLLPVTHPAPAPPLPRTITMNSTQR